jgi:cytosine/adenosine deaminase-related metal-dependent hydrolase
MNSAEVKAVAHAGAVAGLCPITEANLGDGIFDAPGFLDAGGAFGVGTDSNVEITAPGELRMFEYSQRLGLRARNVVSRREGESTGGALYRAAAAGGARALQRPEGAIAPGLAADFVVLDADNPAFAALKGEQWLDGYIFNTGASAIAGVIANGKLVVERGRHVAREAIAARYAVTMRRLTAL